MPGGIPGGSEEEGSGETSWVFSESIGGEGGKRRGPTKTEACAACYIGEFKTVFQLN